MTDTHQDNPGKRVLVIMPGHVDECVQATAMLQSLRQTWPQSHITALIKHRLRPLLWGLGSVDRVLSIRTRKRKKSSKPGKRSRRARHSVVGLGRRLSRGRFDTAIILPTSFGAAALAAVTGVPRRVGYECDGRGVLLTDRLVVRKHRGGKPATSSLDSYLGIARYLGATNPSSPSQRVHSDAQLKLVHWLSEQGVSDHRGILLLDPATPEDARLMKPICDALSTPLGLLPIVTGFADIFSPAVHALPNLNRDLHLMKAVIASSRLVITGHNEADELARALGAGRLLLKGQPESGPAGGWIEYARTLCAAPPSPLAGAQA